MPDRRLNDTDLENMEAGLAGRLRGIGYLCHPEDMRRLIAEVRLLKAEIAGLKQELELAELHRCRRRS